MKYQTVAEFKTNIDGADIRVENVIRNTLKSETGGEIDSDELVTSECTFTVSKNGKKFAVETYHVQDDHDQYCVSIYDNTSDETRDTMTRIDTTYYDSCGGTTEDGIRVIDLCGERLEDIEAVILTVLFGYNTGLIIPF